MTLVGGQECKRLGALWLILPIAAAASIDPAKASVAGILEYRDANSKPCDNFYQHVCGNYHTSIDKSEINPVAFRSVKKLIEKGIGLDLKPFKLIDDLYKTCMDKGSKGQQGLDLMNEIIEELGGWPLLKGDNWKESDFDLIDFSIKAHGLGLESPLLELDSAVIPNATQVNVMIALLSLHDEFKLKMSASSDVRRDLQTIDVNYLKKLAALLGNKREISEELDDVVNFGREIREIKVSDRKTLTSDDLAKGFPLIDWEKLIDIVVVSNLNVPSEASKIPLVVGNDFFEYIKVIIKTPKRVIANYAIWKIIQHTIPYLPEEFHALKREFYEDRVIDDPERSFDCIEEIRNYLPAAVNLLYAKNYYNRQVDPIAIDIINNVKDELVDLVNESTWIHQDAKKRDIELIKNTAFVIGYEAREKSDEDFVKFYDNLDIDTTNYFQTVLNLRMFRNKYKFNNVTSLGPQDALVSTEFNFAYNGFGRIYISMAMLHEPLLSITNPMPINYGRFGVYIAQQLTRTIFDAERTPDNQVLSCFQHQYDKYSNVSGFYSPPPGSLNEIEIAKHMQFKVAYLAYQRSVKKSDPALPLPGVSYTWNQLFWVSSMLNFCDESSKQRKIDNKFNDFEFMLLKALTSTEQFFNDFQCPNDGTKFTNIYGESCTYL